MTRGTAARLQRPTPTSGLTFCIAQEPRCHCDTQRGSQGPKPTPVLAFSTAQERRRHCVTQRGSKGLDPRQCRPRRHCETQGGSKDPVGPAAQRDCNRGWRKSEARAQQLKIQWGLCLVTVKLMPAPTFRLTASRPGAPQQTLQGSTPRRMEERQG